MSDYQRQREKMVDLQIARRGIRNTAVLAAMNVVPRERFVSPEMAEFAYDDGPLPIGEGQTISQPYIVAEMVEAAEIRPRDRVLEVGAGSGYAAAVMGLIADSVYAIERTRSSPAPHRSAWRNSGIGTWCSVSATGRWDGPRRRPSMPFWSQPAGRRCLVPLRSSSPLMGGS